MVVEVPVREVAYVVVVLDTTAAAAVVDSLVESNVLENVDEVIVEEVDRIVVDSALVEMHQEKVAVGFG